MSTEQAAPRRKSKRPPRPVEGVDYFCAGCTGRRWRPCPDCFGGCDTCGTTGVVKCYVCEGGTIALQPPDWI